MLKARADNSYVPITLMLLLKRQPLLAFGGKEQNEKGKNRVLRNVEAENSKLLLLLKIQTDTFYQRKMTQIVPKL